METAANARSEQGGQLIGRVREAENGAHVQHRNDGPVFGRIDPFAMAPGE